MNNKDKNKIIKNFTKMINITGFFTTKFII